MYKKARASRAANQLQSKYSYLYERPVDLQKLAKQLQIHILDEEFPEDSNISAILVKKGSKAVIAVNNDHSLVRKRFSIAHEIGHWMLHSDAEKLDIAKGALSLNVFRRSEKHDLNEMEANQFAAELLMPSELLENDFNELMEEEDENFISRLARLYKVSESALTYRLKNLGLIELN